MSLKPEDMNDLKYVPETGSNEEKTLGQWIDKYREKYPVVAILDTANSEETGKPHLPLLETSTPEEPKGECPWPFIMLHDPLFGTTRHPVKNAVVVLGLAYLLW